MVGWSGAAGEGLCYVEQVFVKELDVHVVLCSGVELLGEVVNPGAAQGMGRDSGSGKHSCGC